MKHTKEEFEEAVKTSYSIREVLKKLGLVPAGGNYKEFHKKVSLWGVDTSHFTGQGHNKGKSYYRPRKALVDVLVENSTYTTTSTLRKRLIKEGYLEDKCSSCGIDSWLGESITLHLDHINGTNNDNRIENLRLLCPNCHSQTPTYCGKNRNGGEKLKRTEKEKYERRKELSKKDSCPVCGKEKSSLLKTCSKECAHKFSSKVDWGSIDLDLLLEKYNNNLTAIGKHLGVSDNTVRKRLKK